MPTKAQIVDSAVGSVRAEGLEPSAEALEALEKFSAGEITAFELHQTVSAKKTIKKET